MMYTKAASRLQLLKELRSVSYCALPSDSDVDSYHALAPTNDVANVRLGRTTMPALGSPIELFHILFDAWCEAI